MAYSYCWCCGNPEIVVGSTASVSPLNLLHYYTRSGSFSKAVEIPEASPQATLVWDIAIGPDSSVYSVMNNGYVSKHDETLAEVWTALPHASRLRGVAVDASGDSVYICGIPDGGYHIRKIDAATGAEVTSESWPVFIGPPKSPSSFSTAFAIAIDSGGNIWCGHTSTSLAGNPTLSKYTSSGTLVARYQPFSIFDTTNSFYQFPFRIRVDSSDNMYVCLTAGTLAGSPLDMIKKLDSTATEIWGIQGDSHTNDGYGVALFDSESKVAVSCQGGVGNNLYVFDADGNLIWSDAKTGVSVFVDADLDGNIYVARRDALEVNKYDIDGNEITDNWPNAIGNNVYSVRYVPR
jgi:hypothetical protein